MRKSRSIFAHSAKDALLVVIALCNVALLVVATVTYGRVSFPATGLMSACLVFLVATNYQCVAHNFIHHPFFESRRLNAIFSVFNSIVLGVPQTIYRIHHLHHHKFNNDRIDPSTGTTRDRTSTWRYSRDPNREENLLSYAFIGFFRQDFGFLLEHAKQRGLMKRVVIEGGAWATMLLALAWINPIGTLVVFLGSWYLGQTAALGENYLEHHGAIPGSRETDSVSCYGNLYNLVWFNNGYHQEHHLRPQCHWTLLPAVREELPSAKYRRVCKGAHWFNLFPPPLSAYPVRKTARRQDGKASPEESRRCRTHCGKPHGNMSIENDAV